MLDNLISSDGLSIALYIVLPILGICIGGFLVFLILKNSSKKKIGNAKVEAEKILEDAKLEAKNLRKEAVIESKEEQLRLRNEFENETKSKRSELQKIENRLNQKEDLLDKKEIALDLKIDAIEKSKEQIEKDKKLIEVKNLQIEEIKKDLETKKEEIIVQIENVSGMKREEAKQFLIDKMVEEAQIEASATIKEIETKAKEEGEKRAKDIVGLAIQRCAVDTAAETTISVVELPGDEMKGRIIGRVGRNIKSFESITGVDVIIDDTPDVVTLTSFDPVRREIARITLQKLVSDGRIHPGRIEDVANRVRKDIENEIKEAGEDAVYQVGLFGIHPELVKLLGRLKYRTSYGQNVLSHSLEVANLAGLLAQELGADIKLAKRAGLLHDIGKAVDHEYEGTHVQIGVDLARKYKEKDNVINAIAAHHGDVEPQTLEAILVQAADAISGGRPGARRESLENYVKRLESLESIANSFAGVEQSYAIQAGREIRVIVKPEEVDDKKTEFLAKDIAKKLENELEYPGQIKVNVIRELRSVEYAK